MFTPRPGNRRTAPTSRSTWRRTCAITLVAVLAAVGLALPASAHGATCGFSLTTVTITVASGETITVGRTVAGDITVTGGGSPPCGGATVSAADSIVITGAGGSESVTIDLTNGAFEPGNSAEASGSPEIEWSVDLAGGSGDAIAVSGGPGSDTLTYGTGGLALNGDSDVDVTLVGIETHSASGAGAADRLSGAGGNGAGGPFASALTLSGGAGSDAVIGGSGDDVLDGGADDDTVTGAGGDDTIIGGAGNDTENGDAGNDTLSQGAVADGNDALTGGSGVDTVSYASRSNPVAISADGGANDGEASEGDNVASDIETHGGGSGDDTFSQGAASDGA